MRFYMSLYSRGRFMHWLAKKIMFKSKNEDTTKREKFPNC